MKIAYISKTSFADTDFPLIKSLIKNGNTVYYFVYVHRNLLKGPMIEIEQLYSKLGIFDSSVYGDSIDKYKKYLGLKKIWVINDTSSHVSYKQAALEFFLMRELKCIKPDIIHKIGTPPFFSMIPNYLLSKKLVVTIHDPVPHENERLLKSRVLNCCGMRGVKNYVLLNKQQTSSFKEYYKISSDVNIYYSHLGFPDILGCYGEINEDNGSYILFYGRITDYKGVDVLLTAFNNIKKEYPNIKLIIAGKGNLPFNISDYKNDSQIKIINRYISIEEMCTLIKNCLFVVCPYKNATQSGVVASVLAMNKPLIVTNVGGLANMIDEGKSGLIIPPNEVDSLATNMNYLLSHVEVIDKMVRYIKELSANGRYSWDIISQSYIKIYQKILLK